jgi:hypothetical protein
LSTWIALLLYLAECTQGRVNEIKIQQTGRKKKERNKGRQKN